MGWLHDLFTPSTWAGDLGLTSKPAQTDPALTSAISQQNTLLAQQTAQAQTDAAAALAAQTDANAIAASASVPATDSESSRAASDNQQRKLLQGSSFGIGLPDKLGAPPVGFRILSGQ